MVHYVTDVVREQSTQSKGGGCVCEFTIRPAKLFVFSGIYSIYFTTNLKYSIVDYKHRQNIEKL